MEAIRLVPIDCSGYPTGLALPLSDVAWDVCAGVARGYGTTGFFPPWIGYFAVQEASVVGTCAFKGPPVDGRVEIAYFTFREFEGRGIATAMARALVDLARREQHGIEVCAQTLPEESGSTTILKRLGFSLTEVAEFSEPGRVWEWQLPPAAG